MTATKKTNLLVEDEYDTRELLGRALERAGYQCIAASEREQALALAGAAGNRPRGRDVMRFAGADNQGGLALLTALRKLGVRAPVIVITAYADVEKLKIALNEGAAHFLEKPFSAPKLLSAIEHVLSNHHPLNHAVEEVLARAQLTEKELTVARLLLDGLSSSEIAELEHNSPKTIRQHVTQIYAKCGVASRGAIFFPLGRFCR